MSDPFFNETDPRIRSRIKMKRICNTASNYSTKAVYTWSRCPAFLHCWSIARVNYSQTSSVSPTRQVQSVQNILTKNKITSALRVTFFQTKHMGQAVALSLTFARAQTLISVHFCLQFFFLSFKLEHNCNPRKSENWFAIILGV